MNKKIHYKESNHITLCGKHYTGCLHPYRQRVIVGGVNKNWRLITCLACKKYRKKHKI